jgi:hypothetical protein
MANLSTYTAIVQAEVDDTSARAQTVIDRALKDTYQEIMKHTGRFLLGTEDYAVTATIGRAGYVPEDHYEVISVYWTEEGATNASILDQITEEEAIDKHLNDADGTPQYYYRNTTRIVLVPPPDNAGTLGARLVHVTDELGAGDSLIPERYTNVIILGAVSRFKMYEGVPEAIDYQAKYAASLQDMKKELSAQFTQVKPKFFGW